jgi:hypothetical protein
MLSASAITEKAMDVIVAEIMVPPLAENVEISASLLRAIRARRHVEKMWRVAGDVNRAWKRASYAERKSRPEPAAALLCKEAWEQWNLARSVARAAENEAEEAESVALKDEIERLRNYSAAEILCAEVTTLRAEVTSLRSEVTSLRAEVTSLLE